MRPREQMVDIDRVRENPDNIRTVMTHLEGLAASIRSVGLRDAIVVHRKFEAGTDVQDLELIDGARRLAAHHLNRARKIRAIVYPYMEPREILLMMLTTTFREDPDAAGMRAAVCKLRDRHAMTTIQIAEELGTSVGQVQAWFRGDGKIVEAPLRAPGTPTPERPRPPGLTPESELRDVVTGRAAGQVAANGSRARRGSARTPTVSARRVFDLLEDYDNLRLDGNELAKRLRGALGGWRPS